MEDRGHIPSRAGPLGVDHFRVFETRRNRADDAELLVGVLAQDPLKPNECQRQRVPPGTKS